jgi:hypothetical protein
VVSIETEFWQKILKISGLAVKVDSDDSDNSVGLRRTNKAETALSSPLSYGLTFLWGEPLVHGLCSRSGWGEQTANICSNYLCEFFHYFY